MPRTRSWRRHPHFEFLETRLELSATVPVNSIGTALGNLLQPRAISSISVMAAARNLTAGKPATLFGLFVAPLPGSALAPRIVGVEESNGHRLAIKQGRPYLRGRDSGEAAAFVKVEEPGPLVVQVTGQHHSTGSYQVDVTLPGDVNGDGTVTPADLQPFASAYFTAPGNPKYNRAADFNQNGIVNLYDAKALMQNIPPLAANVPLTLEMNLLPADQAHYPTPRNSGGATSRPDVTIIGHTVPGSIVLEDNSNGYYKWDGPAFATDAKGFFSVPAKLTQGVNTFNFLVVDPFSRQLVRSYPIFWLPFAAPHSKLK